MCESFNDAPKLENKPSKNPEDADADDDTEEGTSKIVMMDTIVKKNQKKMPSYLQPTKTSKSRINASVVQPSKTKRDRSPAESTRQSKMFTTATTPTKRSKSPTFNSGDKVTAYSPTPIKELKLQCEQFIVTVKEY